jgi:hypothetical protein
MYIQRMAYTRILEQIINLLRTDFNLETKGLHFVCGLCIHGNL